MIEGPLKAVPMLGSFEVMNDHASIRLVLDIVAHEHETSKGRMQCSVEVYRGGWACADRLVPSGGSNAATSPDGSNAVEHPEELNKIGKIRSVCCTPCGWRSLRWFPLYRHV